MNLLTNPGFNDGHHHQDNIAEIVVPDGWHLYWIDNDTFPGCGNPPAYRPESMVWNISGAPPHEKDLFFLDGIHCLKVFKPWAPIYFAFTQAVSGLTPGVKYRFNAQVFPDIVIRHEGGHKVRPHDDVWHSETRVGWSDPHTPWPHGQDGDVNWATWFNMTNENLRYGEYNDVWLEFVAPSNEVRIWLECKSKWGNGENNWFMDAFTLTAVGGEPAPAPSPSPTPEPSPTPAPGAGRGAPRVQYARTYLLLPSSTPADLVAAAAKMVQAKNITMGFSPDDAGIGDLDERRVICLNPDQIGGGLSQDWYTRFYPGVQFIGVQADTPNALKTTLMTVI